MNATTSRGVRSAFFMAGTTAIAMAVVTAVAGCESDAAPAICLFDETYSFTTSHGLNPRSEMGVLSPPSSFMYSSLLFAPQSGDAPLTCAPPLPACGTASRIDVADLMADITVPAVQQALAQASPPSFGSMALDGDALSFTRASGGAFSVSLPLFNCTSPSQYCVPIPAGIQKLVNDLQALAAQSLQDPSCAALR